MSSGCGYQNNYISVYYQRSCGKLKFKKQFHLLSLKKNKTERKQNLGTNPNKIYQKQYIETFKKLMK